MVTHGSRPTNLVPHFPQPSAPTNLVPPKPSHIQPQHHHPHPTATAAVAAVSRHWDGGVREVPASDRYWRQHHGGTTAAPRHAHAAALHAVALHAAAVFTACTWPLHPGSFASHLRASICRHPQSIKLSSSSTRVGDGGRGGAAEAVGAGSLCASAREPLELQPAERRGGLSRWSRSMR